MYSGVFAAMQGIVMREMKGLIEFCSHCRIVIQLKQMGGVDKPPEQSRMARNAHASGFTNLSFSASFALQHN